MAKKITNSLAKRHLEAEGYKVWIVERRLWQFNTVDFFLCGDLFGHWPNGERMDRIVQSCGEDVQPHITKMLTGWTDSKGKLWPPNPYLPTLLLKYEFQIYSMVLRSEQRGGRKMRVCRKWQAVLSPTGQVSFERINDEK